MIKGTFKDHLVSWVHQFIKDNNTEADAARIMDDIDRKCVSFLSILLFYHTETFDRISAVPVFPGIRRFTEGRNYERWTGDDTKALMKVSPVSHMIRKV